ncbi:hypothetical protein Pmar_PMAR002695 [Perkinsus marinus ATCC 50983]|uniref:Uncharacterized protein n=1 Tax=Perkinsus marinus (strain ATCC 50983 / TXsc) TaxID=423536 RepID=C5L1L4_PERM5|nr:hypothetical protein Pmar_PMAR002695 [Perkinsus marinus ATCC 50983]EER09379.1 hypothetical protein Pmar_PMAR002695 [Perkinsus marinus ATCC 50983]|eukprot:XP_002777563.1 hypothetical protein Pmar_PMAR002695 [Perkinsus marinus ATCC 50983]
MAIDALTEILAKEGRDEPIFYYSSAKVDTAKIREFSVDGDAKAHAAQARVRAHPLDSKPSLPDSPLAAIDYQSSATSEVVNKERRSLLGSLRARASELGPTAEIWRCQMDPGVRSISGHLNLPLLQELIQLTQYSDTQLAKDIQQGLPVIGKMPEIKGVFAPLKSNPDPKESNKKKKTKKKKKLTASQLLDEASSSMRKTLNEIRLGEFDEEIWTATLAE